MELIDTKQTVLPLCSSLSASSFCAYLHQVSFAFISFLQDLLYLSALFLTLCLSQPNLKCKLKMLIPNGWQNSLQKLSVDLSPFPSYQIRSAFSSCTSSVNLLAALAWPHLLLLISFLALQWNTWQRRDASCSYQHMFISTKAATSLSSRVGMIFSSDWSHSNTAMR